MTDFRERYADLGAFVHGKAPRRTAPLPPAPIPQPARPTTAMTVGGIQIEPAARLTVLASIRDRHRASARAASDRAAELRLRIAERDQRIKLLVQNAQPGYPRSRAAQGSARQPAAGSRPAATPPPAPERFPIARPARLSRWQCQGAAAACSRPRAPRPKDGHSAPRSARRQEEGARRAGRSWQSVPDRFGQAHDSPASMICAGFVEIWWRPRLLDLSGATDWTFPLDRDAASGCTPIKPFATGLF